MINFRFHVVSLIAIFLALALGVIVGFAFIDRGVVDTLNDRLDRVESRSDRLESDNSRLGRANDQLRNAIGGLGPFAAAERFTAVDVGFIAVRGIDDDPIKQAVTVTQAAGANVTGVLWLEEKWELTRDDDLKAMQTLLTDTTRNRGTLRTTAWKRLADRLGPTPTAADPTDSDLLDALRSAGFIGFDALGVPSATLEAFAGPNAAMVLVTGTKGSIPEKEVVTVGAGALSAAGLPVVVADVYVEGENGRSRGDALSPLRDSELARTVSTVDDLDLAQGPITVVLAVAGLVRSPPVVGHYGFGADTRPVPEATAASVPLR
jgi:hypothetical protein